MPRVSEQHRLARREEILDAAMRSFQCHGFQAASMADIIAESGLSAGAIYGHFPSKTAIIHEVASRVIGARVDDLERHMALDPLPPPASLLRVITSGMLRDVGRASLVVQIWGEAVADLSIRDLVHGVFGRLLVAWTAYLSRWHQQESGLDPAQADALAEDQLPLYLAAVQGYILQSALLPGFDAERYLTAAETYLPR